MQKNHNEPEMPSSVFVALVGRPNVGKSSLTNYLVGEKVAIVTKKPQTTRSRITGVITKGPVQYVLMDTPGIHAARNKLDARMTQTAAASLKDVDVTMMLFEPAGEFTDAELTMVKALQKGGPAIAVINKVDLLDNFAALEARKKQLEEFGCFDHIVTISAKDGTGCDELFAMLKPYGNEGPHYFDDDAFTDMPEKELVAELVREKALLFLREEVPHGIAVVVERFKERPDKDLIDIDVDIYCERKSHKGMIIGKGGQEVDKLKEELKKLTGKEGFKGINPDECVAMGAAVQGGLLQGGGKLAGATGAAAQGLVLMDVTPLTLSIETLGGVATPLITRNSMIPTRKSQIFTTARPMQTSVEINVLQGERHFARDNKSLGKFKLTGIRSGFSSKPQIEVTFDIDVNGVVKVSAKDLGTGREQNITITGSTNLSENEIQRAMADAAAYEEEDTRRRERLELHNQAEMLAYKVDEALSKCKKELDKDEKNRVKNDLASLRRCLRKDKPEKMNETEEAALRQAKSQLEASANHLMLLYSAEQTPGDGTDSTL